MTESNDVASKMIVYVTTQNTGPSWSSDPLYVRYLGTSLKRAIEAVGDFVRYERETSEFPTKYPDYYSAIPKKVIDSDDWELVRYYMADGWWYSIVKFKLEES